MIFTLNEEVHLPLCLMSLSEFDDIIVVDSYSTDRTPEICKEMGIRFFQHRFEGFGQQRNWAIQHIETQYEWILILDADERVTADLAQEIRQKISGSGPTFGAFRLKRRFFMWGRWLKRSSLYPTWVVRLVHRDRILYSDRGHAETQTVTGQIVDLQNDLIDENLKGIDEWFSRQNRYSTQDATYELSSGFYSLSFRSILSTNPLQRRTALKSLVARMPARGIAYFFYSYFYKLGFLDGRDGLMFCLMRSLYQTMIGIKKYDMLKRGRMSPADSISSRRDR
jgi:glycosyltransferase involved in cell wall biosynthesis